MTRTYATQISQTAGFPIEGPVVAAFADGEGHRYLVVEVLTPLGNRDVILDFNEVNISQRRVN